MTNIIRRHWRIQPQGKNETHKSRSEINFGSDLNNHHKEKRTTKQTRNYLEGMNKPPQTVLKTTTTAKPPSLYRWKKTWSHLSNPLPGCSFSFFFLFFFPSRM